MIAPKRIMKKPWLSSRLNLKRLNYGRRKGWEGLIEHDAGERAHLVGGRTVLLTGEMIAHIKRNVLLFYFLVMGICLCVHVFIMCMQAHGGHKRASDLLELE